MKYISTLFVLVALSSSQAISLRKVAILPRGAFSDYTRVKVFDADHNGKNDIVFKGGWTEGNNTMSQVFFYGYDDYDCFRLRDSINICTAPGFYDIGHIDNDSLTDAIVQCNLGGVYSYAVVFESPDYYSYPTQIVWQWRYEFSGGSASPSYIHDLDRDGKQDILTKDCNVIYIFECIGDNQYQKVWWDTIDGGASLGAAGDFDLDGANEFLVTNGYDNRVVRVYECAGDNQYAEVFTDTLPYYNQYDVWPGNDLDGDNRPEFLIGCFHWPYSYYLIVYESVGNNDYEWTLVDSIVSKEEFKFKASGHSSCGDIDGDGRDEIVWAIADRFSVYKATGNNQYQMLYRSPRKRYTSTHAVAYDVNKNGYAEIIESALIDSPYVRTETSIWEIEGVRLHRPNGGEVLQPGSQFPITWEKFSPPGADSFTLFVSFNNGADYRTITTMRQSDDTLFLWTVPDSLSDSCKLMIWAYGPPRAGQQVSRGTAWDFSDSTFSIRQTGVAEDARYRIYDAGLKILQNPSLSKNLRIQYSVPKAGEVKLVICNTLGQVEEVLVNQEMKAGKYWATVQKRLCAGVYFITFSTENTKITKKVVIFEEK